MSITKKNTTDSYESVSAPYVFISYSSKNANVASLICNTLENAEVKCWMAPRDVLSGLDYDTALMGAISDCSVFLLIFSENSSKSKEVRKEVEYAAKKQVPILPCLIDHTNPDDTSFSYHLGSQHRFDASNGPIETHLQRLVEQMKKLITLIQPESINSKTHSSSANSPIIGDLEHKKSGQVIGIDVGSTKIRGCVLDIERLDSYTDSSHDYIEDVRRPATASSILVQVKAMIAKIVDEKLLGNHPLGIGIAVPGQVDLRAGILKFAPGLGVRSVPFRTYFANLYPGVPIRVDNDARCATRCELHLGVGREFDSFVCIFVGTGVGSGTVINRHVLFGHNYCAGEIGHIKISSNGPPCTCGQIGCLETFVKGPAILDLARAKAIEWESRGLLTLLQKQGELLDTRGIVAAMDEGDEAAKEVIEEVAAKFGMGIASYLNIVNPAAVTLGGGVMSGFFLHMVDGITRAMQKNALAEVANTPLIQSQHMDDGAALGAALLFHANEDWRF